MSEAPNKPRRSLDEVLAEIEEIAFDKDSGADKMRALKMLRDQTAGGVAIAEPLTDEEERDRLARMMKGAGSLQSRLAFHQAFPNAQKHITTAISGDEIVLDPDLIPPGYPPRTMKAFNRMFPSLKQRGGHPKGYPKGRGEEVKRIWLEQAARKILVDRQRAAMLEKQGQAEVLKQEEAAAKAEEKPYVNPFEKRGPSAMEA